MKVAEICLDANVFVASLTHEPDQEVCLELMNRLDLAQTALFEPALLVFEVTSSLRKKQVLGNLLPDEAEEGLGIFFNLPLLLQWQDFLMKKSLQISNQLRLKNAYDSCYLAVAMTREIPLVTLDLEFKKKAQSYYKKIFTVEEFLRQQ